MNRKRSLLFASGIMAVLLASGVFSWRIFFKNRSSQIEALWASRTASAPQLQTIPGSVSPDGQWKIVRFEFGETTDKVCFVLTNRSGVQFVGLVPAFESDFRSTSQFNEGTTLLWSPDSRHFAMHDRSPRHSVPTLHRIANGQLIQLPVRGSETVVGSKSAGVLSSGFRLKQWSSNTRLEMDAILRVKDGEAIKPAALQIDSESALIVP